MRRSERELEFVRVRGAVGTAGQLTGEPTLTGVLSARPCRPQGAGRASCGPSADWRRRVHWWADAFALGVGGETGGAVPLIVTTGQREGQ